MRLFQRLFPKRLRRRTTAPGIEPTAPAEATPAPDGTDDQARPTDADRDPMANSMEHEEAAMVETPDGETAADSADAGTDHDGTAPGARQGWPSCEPVVVGRPSPKIEPVSVKPEYRTGHYRPDSVLDGWSTGTLTVRAASLRGLGHRYDGSPRQDDFAIVLRPDGRLLIAVADGVSAAQQSHLGATAAVRYATQWLDRELPERTEDTDWPALVKSTAWALTEQAGLLDPMTAETETTAATVEEASKLLATTLVCAVVEPGEDSALRAHVVTVADSGAWLLGPAGFSPRGGGKHADGAGITSSAVIGLPYVPKDLLAIVIDIATEEVLLLATDGFGDPLGSGDGKMGAHWKSVLAGRTPTIIEFAHALDFSRESFDDDRTLVAVWPRSRP